MKNKMTARLSIFMCLVLILSMFAACSVKDKTDITGTTAPYFDSGNDSWISDGGYEPVTITNVELVQLVNDALGSDAAGWDGNLGSLTNEQLEKVEQAAQDKGLIIEKDESGNTVIKKEEVPTTQATPEEVTKIMNQVSVQDLNNVSPSQLVELSKVAAENNMAVVTKPGTSEVVIVKPVQTRPVNPVKPSNPAAAPSTQKVVTAAPITPPTAARTTSVYKPVPNPPVPSLSPTVKPVPGFTTAWVNTLGGVSNDVLVDSAVLSNGNVVSAGITFTNDKGTASSSSSGIIAAYNEKNKQLWSKTISGDETVAFQSVAVLNDGSIVAVGYTSAESILGLTDADFPCKGTIEAIAVKFNKDGDIIWAKLYGGSTGDMAYAVQATPDGGFVIGGKSESKDYDFKDLGTERIKAFVFKCDANGNIQWRQALSGDKHSAVKDIAVTPAGEIYADIECVTGTGEYAAIEGTKNAKRTTVICKLGTSGNILWTKALYDSGVTNLHAIEVAKDGGCVVAGNYTASANGTSGTFKGIYNAGTPGTFDGMIVKLKPDGSMGWLLPLIGFESDYITGIAKVDGGFAVSGYTTSTNRDFSSTNRGDYDCFIYTFNEYGSKKNLYSLGGSGSDNARGLSSDGSGTVYICGSTNSGDGYFAECKAKGSENKAVAFIARFVISE